MSVEVVTVLDAEQWRAYQEVFAFVGNELLTPMNRSGNLQGLDPAFWELAPEPENELGISGLERLRAYARAAREASDKDDPSVPGKLQASVEYAHLFIGPPAPVADPWETTNDPANEGKVGYGRATVAMQQLLADEGLELAGESNQYEDHMGVELLYLSVLCDKAAVAFEEGTTRELSHEAVLPIARKAAWFASAHPLFWMERLRANVDAERPEGYYSALLAYVHGVLQDFSATLRGNSPDSAAR